MEKKERKLPNRTDIPIDIPTVKIEGKYYPAEVKSFTFTASPLLPMEYKEDIAKIGDMMKSAPWFFSPRERKASEIANLRLKAKNLLGKPFSAGLVHREFGAAKFPNAKIQCYKCGNVIEYVVDFFVHVVLDHGTDIRDAERVFDDILNRI